MTGLAPNPDLPSHRLRRGNPRAAAGTGGIAVDSGRQIPNQGDLHYGGFLVGPARPMRDL